LSLHDALPIFTLVGMEVICAHLLRLTSPEMRRVFALPMPRQILKPRSLDFYPDASVGIRPSFEPKLLFSLLAFKLRWKSTHRNALTCVRHRLNTPMGISILSQP